MSNAFRNERVHVCAEECPTCIFRPGNKMRLTVGRVAGMVDEALQNDSAIICHSTLDGDNAVCRGFYDRFGSSSAALRAATAFGVITEVDPKTLEPIDEQRENAGGDSQSPEERRPPSAETGRGETRDEFDHGSAKPDTDE